MSGTYQNETQQIDVANNWFQRFVAAIIDGIPFAIVFSIIGWLLFWGAGFGSPMWQFMVSWGWAFSFFLYPMLIMVPLLIYCVVMEAGAKQATFGKKIMGLQVQTVNGGKPNSGQALKRNISKILWILFLIDILLGLATKGPDPRQRYFDRIAGTTVVSTKEPFGAASYPPPPPPPPPPA